MTGSTPSLAVDDLAALRAEIEQFCRRAAEDFSLLVVAERCHGEDTVHRMQLPGIGIVAAYHDLAGSDLGHQVPDCLGFEDQRIEIDLLEIFRRRLLELHLGVTAFWSHQE